jgi:hypothetical protein
MYRSWGGTVINMSTLPEAKLAAEAEIAYQVILMSTDYDVRFLYVFSSAPPPFCPRCLVLVTIAFPLHVCSALRCVAFGGTAFPFPFPFPRTTGLLILSFFLGAAWVNF